MSAQNRCRGCGNLLPNEALNGLCPMCLLREGLATNDQPIETATNAASSVLATLDRSIGALPKVLLRDSDVANGAGPLVQPGSPEMPPLGNRPARLQLLGEIARGGMGAVLKGRDPDLGRELAVKVLLGSHRDKPDLVRRFIEEAQIGGQLQHPGIVPIYELGTLPDYRPYFAMKLVKGRTLSSLLGERSDQAHDLPRFLAIFESVCQTIAYAHARGVIHRDLKPSNIMVGSFGEVQVMDWGLAKVLPQGGAADDARAGKTCERDTVIATARSGGDRDSDLSQAGSVMGTPSYMAPEQARGEVNRLDERCDVFALGSILCELLTGEPAFTGRSPGEIQRKAAGGDLQNAFDRLAACSASGELVSLARDCLAAEPFDRPSRADVVAERIADHREGVQEQLRLAEIARAQQTVRAEEAGKRARVERDRLRLTVALAASILGLIVLSGGGWAYLAQVRAARRAATERLVTAALDQANLLRGQAKAAPVGDLSQWPDAIAAARQARTLLLGGEPSAALRLRVNTLLDLLEAEQAVAADRAAQASRERRFVERLEAIRLKRFEQEGKWAPQLTDESYATAFREFGIDVEKLDPTEAGRLLSQCSNPPELAFFVDDWTFVRREVLAARGEDEKNADSWQRLSATARAADPDPWRNELRSSFGGKDPAAVKRLAQRDEALAAQPARSLLLFARVLKAHGELAEVEMVLKPAWRLRPDDFWICSLLAESSEKEKVRFASAAVALRPDNYLSHQKLAEALAGSNESLPFALVHGGMRATYSYTDDPASWTQAETPPLRRFSVPMPVALDSFMFSVYTKLGQPHCELICVAPYQIKANDEIIAECQEALRLNPNDAAFRRGYARLLMHLNGKFDEAVNEYRRAVALQPLGVFLGDEFAFHLARNGRSAEAIGVVREVIHNASEQQRRGLAPVHLFLGSLLRNQGKREEAVSEFRAALLRAGTSDGDLTLDVGERFLRSTARPEDAIAVLRERLKLQPHEIITIAHLGDLLRSEGRFDEQGTLYREAIRLDPAEARLHGFLARVLLRQRKLDEAKAEFAAEVDLHRAAVKRTPQDASARHRFAESLFDQGMWDQAVAELREAFRILPTAAAHSRLAMNIYSRGHVNEAIALSREAVQLNGADASARYNLGYYLLDSGETDAAFAEFLEALRIEPNNPFIQDRLGLAQLARGQLNEALESFKAAARVIEEVPHAGFDVHLRRVERLSALEGLLATIQRGEAAPATAQEALELADLCRLTRRFRAATQFYGDAFQMSPSLADDLEARHRLQAAIAAARAGTDLTAVKGDIRVDGDGRARARARSLGWLRDLKDACAKVVLASPATAGGSAPGVTDGLPSSPLARKSLDIMTHHRDLVSVRDDKHLVKLPEAEQKQWRRFWAEVAELINRAE